jgi:DNA-binding response OmpR family regulator
MKILVLDNDKNTAETFKATINSKTDHQVDVAYGGKEGLEKMGNGESPYDLLVLDIMMPEVSGIDVCKAMMQDEKLKKIPVLLVSALPVSSQTFQDSMGKFKELKVIKEVLEKPFSGDELVAKIEKSLGK